MRGAAGVLAGLLTGLTLITLFEGLGHALFPPPDAVDLTDPGALASAMSQISLGAKLFLLIGWTLGVLGAASVANLIAARRPAAGRITAAALISFCVWTLVTLPHPAWLAASLMSGTLVAAGLAERAFGRPRSVGLAA